MVTFTFIDHLLDVERRELRRAGEPVPLEPQVFDLLVYLVVNRERVVGKDELIDSVWGGRIVSDSAVTTRINAVRRAVGDSGSEQRIIRTVQRKGVRFVAEVSEEFPSRSARVAFTTGPVQASLPLPDKASIAVLPFQNMSGDPEQEYFVDGMVEEIITALSRIRWLFVIARNSTFTYKGQAVEAKQVGRELGVRYVLEGSVRKAGDRVRITAQLIDSATGSHLWADRFDGSLEDVFELQDQVASSVAGIIGPALQAAEITRSVSRPTTDLTAYDLYLRACAMDRSSSRYLDALQVMERAIALDPRYGPALAIAAMYCFRLIVDGRSKNAANDRLRGIDYARRALEVAGDDPDVLANSAWVLAGLGEDIDTMIALVDSALVLNPNSARVWFLSGLLRNWAGHHDIAIKHAETSLRLSPRSRVGTQQFLIGHALFASRRFGEALPKLLLAAQDDPTAPLPTCFLAACYAHLDRLDDAREVVRRLRAIAPVIPDVSFLRNAEHRELFLSGLRRALGDDD